MVDWILRLIVMSFSFIRLRCLLFWFNGFNRLFSLGDENSLHEFLALGRLHVIRIRRPVHGMFLGFPIVFRVRSWRIVAIKFQVCFIFLLWYFYFLFCWWHQSTLEFSRIMELLLFVCFMKSWLRISDLCIFWDWVLQRAQSSVRALLGFFIGLF